MSVRLRERLLPSGKVQLYLDIYHKGHRKSEALDLHLTGDRKIDKETRELAQKIRAKRELEISNESEGFTSSGRRKTNVMLYARSVYEGKSVHASATYRNAFLYLEQFAGKDLIFEKVTPRFCEQYKNYLLSGKKAEPLKMLKRNSAAAYYEKFRSVLKRAVEDGIIQQNPSKGISISLQEALPKYLTITQLQQLAVTQCGNEIVRQAFFFSCNTGLRYGDIVDLTWGQVRDGGIHIVQSKTGSSQKIDLNKTAENILKKYRQDGQKASDHIFLLPRRSTVDKVLKRWAVRAGIGISLSFHKARHTFATMLLTKTGDIYTTSKMLGHKNLTTTQMYARVIDEKRKTAIEQLPEIDGI